MSASRNIGNQNHSSKPGWIYLSLLIGAAAGVFSLAESLEGRPAVAIEPAEALQNELQPAWRGSTVRASTSSLHLQGAFAGSGAENTLQLERAQAPDYATAARGALLALL